MEVYEQDLTIEEIMAVADSVPYVPVKKKRGQRGKGKKEAAVSVSIRIPADVLKIIDDKAEFNGMDRTAMILSILSKGY